VPGLCGYLTRLIKPLIWEHNQHLDVWWQAGIQSKDPLDLPWPRFFFLKICFCIPIPTLMKFNKTCHRISFFFVIISLLIHKLYINIFSEIDLFLG
jgi:hypothetical protein